MITVLEWAIAAVRLGLALILVGAMIAGVVIPLILLITLRKIAIEEYLGASEARAAFIASCSWQYEAPSEILACRQLREGEPVFWNAMEATWARTMSALEEL